MALSDYIDFRYNRADGQDRQYWVQRAMDQQLAAAPVQYIRHAPFVGQPRGYFFNQGAQLGGNDYTREDLAKFAPKIPSSAS